MLEIHFEGDERQPPFLGLHSQFVDLRPMEKKLAFAGRLKILPVPHEIGSDVKIMKKNLIAFEARKAPRQTRLPFPQRFDLATAQHNARLHCVQYEIVAPGLLVRGDNGIIIVFIFFHNGYYSIMRIACLLTAGLFWLFILPARAESPPRNFASINADDLARIEAFHSKAEALEQKGDFKGALDLYLGIILLEPDDDAAYAAMGRAYMILGNFERAEDAFQNALHINPDNETAAAGTEKIRSSP